MVVLLFALAALLATAQQRATTALARSGPTVKRWGGRVLLLVGAWLLVLAVFAGTFAGLYPV
ncbi:MAG TPA: hypothetical protein VE776_04790 [Actinomycetota bacterium]|jgi:hypothetical protein|nr:hypothetical protein [Actinomycetota bacterium]